MRTRLTLLGILAGGALLAWPAQAATSNVTIQGSAFHPQSLTVNQGDTVVWKNLDAVTHNARGQGGINSPDLSVNQTYSYAAATPGTFSYICTIHGFSGQLIVRAAATTTARPATTTTKAAAATTSTKAATTTTAAPSTTSTSGATTTTTESTTTSTTELGGTASATVPKHHDSATGPLLAATAVVLTAIAAVAVVLVRRRRAGY